MARSWDVRRWFVRSLLVGLISASGCSSTGKSSVFPGGEKLAPMQDIDTRTDVGPFSRLHEWVAGQKNGRMDPTQVP